MLGIEETALANCFVCLNSKKSVSKVFSLWLNPNKEPKLGRSYSKELGTVASVGTGVCCRCVMRGVGGRGRVVADKICGSAIVVARTSTSEVVSLFSKVFSLWSNPNKEPKLGRSCSEELGTVAGVGISVYCRCVM
ncbi:hypothetical protein Tco_0601530 [Tanacetum coccineum]